jgi:hypothetical protein
MLAGVSGARCAAHDGATPPVRWTVEIRRGDGDGERAYWTFEKEYEARAPFDRCLRTGGDRWRELRY